MPDRYDVIVSGAGPSGSWTALRCSEAGLSVLLLDKREFPREKCCAGGLLHRAEVLLGPRADGLPVQRRIGGISIGMDGQTYRWSTGELGSTVHRSELDNYLLTLAERSGCETRTGARVLRIRESEAKVEAMVEGKAIEADYLVIAEGTASGNAAGTLGPYPRGGLINAAAIMCEGDMGWGESAGFLLPGRRDAAIFASAGARICAAFPVRSGVVLSTVSGSSGPSLIKALEGVARANGLMTNGKGCCHPIAVRPRTRLATDRCLAVGDCAGLASPFSGEGLTPSLASANDAAEAIIDRSRGLSSSLQEYERSVRDRVERAQMIARITGEALHLALRGRWARSLLGGLERDQAFEKAIVSVARQEKGSQAFLLGMLPRLPALLASGAGG
ncbi:MAG: NAD(P)/FAD-dependent oxidoreductase [Methanomassiliicoccales archaeon]|nr:NAD(P)/FAD-dependent oxidoreductase [Methanomassiliicoccales archaeon]